MNYKASIDNLLTQCETEQDVCEIMAYVHEQGTYHQTLIRKAREAEAWEIFVNAFKALRNKGFFLHCEDKVDFDEDITSVDDLKCYFTLNRYEELD